MEYVVCNPHTAKLNAHDLISLCYWAVNFFPLLHYHRAMLCDLPYRAKKNKGLAISAKPLTIYYAGLIQGDPIFW